MGHRCIGLGCWLPELEFTNYWSTSRWTDLIDQHDTHLCVSGSSLAALPFVQSQTPFMAWIATDWKGDRTHRVEQFGWLRRLVDKSLVTFFTKRIEKKIIRSNAIVALSTHTRDELNKLVGYQAVSEVMQMPIDINSFKPMINNAEKGHIKIGFVGRFEDPRKHIALLLHSVANCIAKGLSVKLVLVGDKLSAKSSELIDALSISHSVEVVPYVAREKLPEIFADWDAFVIPSHQEGLCIAALEAMACGLPVISTKCGGPESYIENGVNGYLVDHNEVDLVDAISRLFDANTETESLGKNARETVKMTFSKKAKESQFLALFDRLTDSARLA